MNSRNFNILINDFINITIIILPNTLYMITDGSGGSQ